MPPCGCPNRGTVAGSSVALYAGGLEDNLTAQTTGEPEKGVKKVSPSCNFMVLIRRLWRLIETLAVVQRSLHSNQTGNTHESPSVRERQVRLKSVLLQASRDGNSHRMGGARVGVRISRHVPTRVQADPHVRKSRFVEYPAS